MRNANIQSSVIRAVWSAVEAINKQLLLQLNDTDLSQRIIREVDRVSTLTTEDRHSLLDYINSKIMLIRDIAEFSK